MEGITNSFPRRFGLRALFLLVAACGVLLYVGRSVWPRAGEHRHASECPIDLPPEASDVSYYIGGFWPHVAYEFSIDEAAFLRWATTRGWRAEPVDYFEIRRFVAFVDRNASDSVATSRGGYYYAKLEEDRGLYVGFDRKTGKAFVYRHSR
jgi:hypothetical protein